MTLKAKLLLLTSVLLILLIGLGIFSLYQMNNINMASTEISQNWMPSTNNINALNTAASDFRLYEVMHIYSTSAEDMARYEKQLADEQKEITTLENTYA